MNVMPLPGQGLKTKRSRRYERQIRVGVFLPQDCIDFYLENPTESASRNIKKFLLKHWFENRLPVVSADVPPLIRCLMGDDNR
jgi:hypothetical protein